MQQSAALKRWLSVGITAVVFLVVLILAPGGRTRSKTEGKPEANPEWRMFGGTLQRNLVNDWDRNIPQTWDVETGDNIRWVQDLGSLAYGGPTVANGKVYIGTNNENPRDPKITGDKGVLICFRESDGKFLWQIVHDKLLTGREQDWPRQGICSSPVVEGDKLYYVSNRCELVCADVNGDPANPGKGKILWTLDMIGKLDVFPHNLAVCSPLIVGDTLFLVTANGVDLGHIKVPSPAAPSFLAVNKKNGQVLWQNNLPSASLVEAQKTGQAVNIKTLVDQGKLLMHGQWSNPVYAEPMGKPQIIFPGGDGWIYSFHPRDGSLLWKYDCNPKKSIYKLGPEGTRNDFIATPVIYENKLYLAVGQDPEHDEGVGHLWCIDITKTPKNADKDLSPQDEEFDPKSPKNKDSALVWHYGGPASKGVERTYNFGRSMSTCAIKDGLCYAADLSGWLFCFDARTGEKYWEHNTKGAIWTSPYLADGKLYLGNDDGLMYVFKHGKTKELLEELEMGGKVRALPCVANGTLFLMTENATKLFAIAQGAKLKKD